MATESYTPVVEDLLARVAKLEEIVTTLIGHQHQQYMPEHFQGVAFYTTRPIGMSGTKV